MARIVGLTKQRGRYVYIRRFPTDVEAKLGRAKFVRYFGRLGPTAAETEAHMAGLEFTALCEKTRTDPSQTFLAAVEAAFERADAPTHPLVLVDDDPSPLDFDLKPINIESALSQRATERFVRDTRREVAEKRARLAAKGRTLADAVAVWVERQNPRPPAVKQMERWIERLKKAGAPDDVAAVTVQHVRQFLKRIELDKSFNRQTAAHGLSRLKTLWGHAIARELTDTNPFASIRVASARPAAFEPELPKGLSPADVSLILRHIDDTEKLPPEAAWMLRLALFHGCRVGDLSQLRRQDVQPDRLVIRGAVKNRQTARVLPLRSNCRDFYDFAQRQTAKDGDPVWTGKNLANSAQCRYTRFFRSLGVAGTGHSARHTWIATAVRQECPEYVAKAITGHARGTTAHDRYGTPATFDDMRHWIDTVDPTRD